MGIVGLALGFVISGGWQGRFPVSVLRGAVGSGRALELPAGRLWCGAAEAQADDCCLLMHALHLHCCSIRP